MLSKNVYNRTRKGVNLGPPSKSAKRMPLKTSSEPARGERNRWIARVGNVHSILLSVC